MKAGDEMYGIYYNELFDSLIVTKKISGNELVVFKEDIILLLDEKNHLNGFNVFNVSEDLHINRAFNSFNEQVIAYLSQKLTDHLVFQQESQFVVGKVLKCSEIKETHLHLCEVDLGGKTEQIVCGAPNIAQDQLVVVALVDAWMPNGEQIVASKLRGYESNGMICSQKELGLSREDLNQEGILVLPESYADKVGNDFFKELK